MARSVATQAINTFIAGLVTETTELSQLRNSSYDEDNCLLLSEGNRTRRRGVDFETGASLSALVTSETDMESYAVETFTWTTVAGNGDRNFAVVQIGARLDFFDLGESNVLSNNQKVFSVDLNTPALRAPSYTDVSDSQLEFASGNGYLFCAGPKTIPFIVEYDVDTDTINLIDVNIQIRDFAGLDDGLDIDEEPSSLSAEHRYNLENQGWYVTPQGLDPIDYFRVRTPGDTIYPANNIQWFTTKNPNGTFDVTSLRRYTTGNTKAPRGHYIVDAFNIDRSAVSGIGGLPVEAVNARPKAVAFFAGRVFWGGTDGPGVNGNIYFSQVLQEINQAGLCYQVGDPTSEDDPLLVASDGGVINIPEAGSVQKLVPFGASLIVFADNGVWQITGPDDVFRADNFSIRKITNQGCAGAKTVVDAAGIPIWWGDGGIFSLVADKVSLQFADTSISENTIQTFYLDIPAESRALAKGVYDRVSKKVYWLFRDTEADGVNRFQYNRILWLDTNIRAFYPWTISSLPVNSPYIASVFQTPSLNEGSITELVTDSSNTIVQDSSPENVEADTGSTLRTSNATRFLCIVPDGGGNTQYTFADFDNTSFADWETQDGIGAEYLSYAETWFELNDDIIRYMQAPFVYVYCKRTETTFLPDGSGGFYADNPSSLIVTAKWDFANSTKANRWSRPFQAYKFKQNLLVDPSDLTIDTGYPVVLTRNKIRGKGRALQLRFESEGRNDFNLLGWAVLYERASGV